MDKAGETDDKTEKVDTKPGGGKVGKNENSTTRKVHVTTRCDSGEGGGVRDGEGGHGSDTSVSQEILAGPSLLQVKYNTIIIASRGSSDVSIGKLHRDCIC